MMSNNVGMIIFILFALSFFGGSIYEFLGARKFVERIYFLGLKLMSFKEKWGEVQLQVNDELKETTFGTFKVLNSTTILFRYKWPLFSFVRVGTPFPFKGVIEIKDGIAHVTARTLLAPSIFLFVWFLGWTTGGGAITILSSQNKLTGLQFLLAGYAFFAFILGYSYLIEKKRLLTVLEELKSSLGVQKDSLDTREKENLAFFEWKYNLIFFLIILSFVFGGRYFFHLNELKKITESKTPENLRLNDFQSAFSLGKNQADKNRLEAKWTAECERQKDYSCRFLGYLKELDKDKKRALTFYVKSCTKLDPHSCYNIISNRKHADELDIKMAQSILEPLCSSEERIKFKPCCECYEKEKEEMANIK